MKKTVFIFLWFQFIVEGNSEKSFINLWWAPHFHALLSTKWYQFCAPFFKGYSNQSKSVFYIRKVSHFHEKHCERDTHSIQQADTQSATWGPLQFHRQNSSCTAKHIPIIIIYCSRYIQFFMYLLPVAIHSTTTNLNNWIQYFLNLGQISVHSIWEKQINWTHNTIRPQKYLFMISFQIKMYI